MKKVLIVCGSIWAVIIIAVLVGRLFNTTGLLIALLSLVGLATLVAILDLVLSLKITSLLKKASISNDFEGNLAKAISLRRFPLTNREMTINDMTIIMCLINKGAFVKAKKMLDEINPYSMRNTSLKRALLDLTLDLYVYQDDEDSFNSICKYMNETFRLDRDENFSMMKKASAFYFELENGFIDLDKKEEAEAYYQKWEESSYMDKVTLMYIKGKECSLRHLPNPQKEDLISLAKGTCFESKVSKLDD